MTPLDMSADSVATVQDIAQNILVATKSTDFGGYTGPALSLLTIFGLILVLAPPLKSD